MVDPRRVRSLKEAVPASGTGPVVYWMSRDQRSRDNWALLFAQEKALSLRRPLAVVFCLVPGFLNASRRHYSFMVEGLAAVSSDLLKKNIRFFLLKGDPGKKLPAFLKEKCAAALVTDFDPLRIKRTWKENVASKIKIPFYEVDAHNIVPCWQASPKMEFGAYTIRPKIEEALDDFLTGVPAVKKHPFVLKGPGRINWGKELASLRVAADPPAVSWIKPGEKQALAALNDFIKSRFPSYGISRNDPTKEGTSGLSPYLHFGQLSAQRAALEVLKAGGNATSRHSFIEELVVRRELADNFCFYNKNYDKFEGFPEWARKTLDKHRKDRREYLYTPVQFEKARTHDMLWNAAQTEMVRKGKMHGYMRMYWCKKILEWSKSPEEALKTATYLNDKYELDGRDPNGYTGIAWSIGGVHDRPWFRREVYGNIRYMSAGGCAKKFDVEKYIRQNLKDGRDLGK